jgi:nicotinamidase-related amidase
MAENSAKALLVIDAQVNMFDESFSVYDADGMIGRIGALIEQAHAAGAPVIYIQNNGPQGDVDEPGTTGWEILPALKPQPADIVIQKSTPDSFHETSLQAELTARGVKELIIAGMQTEWCVQTTSRQAANLGYAVTLVRDGHSTFDGKSQAAPEVIAEYNRQLEPVATLKEAAQISF